MYIYVYIYIYIFISIQLYSTEMRDINNILAITLRF